MSEFTCPRCGATSHNPNDVEEGYCGRCHAWTRDEQPWSLTGHARQQMEARGVERRTLYDVLTRPERTQPDVRRTDARYLIRAGVIAVVSESSRQVITVLLDGASRADWERLQAHGGVRKPRNRTEKVAPSTEAAAARPPAPVDRGHVLDGVHAGIAELVRRELAARGLDYRAVNMQSATCVNIMIT
jgi:hypothetical protein